MICDLQWAMINDLSEPYLALRTCSLKNIWCEVPRYEVFRQGSWLIMIIISHRSWANFDLREENMRGSFIGKALVFYIFRDQDKIWVIVRCTKRCDRHTICECRGMLSMQWWGSLTKMVWPDVVELVLQNESPESNHFNLWWALFLILSLIHLCHFFYPSAPLYHDGHSPDLSCNYLNFPMLPFSCHCLYILMYME